MNEEAVRLLIADGEGEKIEFKSELHLREGRCEAVRDLIAMVNTHGERPGYILIGVNNDGTINPNHQHVDSATLEQSFNELIEPRVEFSCRHLTLPEGKITVIEVPFSRQRFHMVKKD